MFLFNVCRKSNLHVEMMVKTMLVMCKFSNGWEQTLFNDEDCTRMIKWDNSNKQENASTKTLLFYICTVLTKRYYWAIYIFYNSFIYFIMVELSEAKKVCLSYIKLAWVFSLSVRKKTWNTKINSQTQ